MWCLGQRFRFKFPVPASTSFMDWRIGILVLELLLLILLILLILSIASFESVMKLRFEGFPEIFWFWLVKSFAGPDFFRMNLERVVCLPDHFKFLLFPFADRFPFFKLHKAGLLKKIWMQIWMIDIWNARFWMSFTNFKIFIN